MGDQDRRLKGKGSRIVEESERTDEFEIVPMRESDLDQVLMIEASSFSSPWTEEMFRHEFLRTSISRCFVAKLKKAEGNVPLREGEVLGYVCLWIIGDEMQVANLAIHPIWRRKGIGRALLKYALDLGISYEAKMVVLEVRASNAGAQRLYRSLGFQVVGTRKGYYESPPEDALVMARDIARRSSWPKIS